MHALTSVVGHKTKRWDLHESMVYESLSQCVGAMAGIQDTKHFCLLGLASRGKPEFHKVAAYQVVFALLRTVRLAGKTAIRGKDFYAWGLGERPGGR